MSVPAELDALRRNLRGSIPADPAPGHQAGAVLVGMCSRPAGCTLVLIRRTADLLTHAGEIAFAGGKVEPGETSLEAALREAQEELGIEPAAVDVLGGLARVETRLSGFAIAPWVGVVPAASMDAIRPNPSEVAEVIEVPLARLTAPGARREQRFIHGRCLIVSPAYDVGAITIWGATGRIVAELLQRIS